MSNGHVESESEARTHWMMVEREKEVKVVRARRVERWRDSRGTSEAREGAVVGEVYINRREALSRPSNPLGEAKRRVDRLPRPITTRPLKFGYHFRHNSTKHTTRLSGLYSSHSNVGSHRRHRRRPICSVPAIARLGLTRTPPSVSSFTSAASRTV